jgi:polysaccharide pyruvyl transferase WcaK-like protein
MNKPVKKIGLLGPYGYGNLGDAAIQQAMIQHIHCYHPDAQVYGFSLNPKDTEKRHGIPSYPIARGFETPDTWMGKIPQYIRNNPVVRWLVRFVVKVPAELMLTAKSVKALKGFDLLIVSGGGQLDDYWGGAWWHPYTLLKYAFIARLRKTKYVFVSVGAGPLNAALSRFFVRKALSLASYRSYRDESSKRFIREIGFSNDEDPVYPDLGYSLQIAARQNPHHQTHTRPMVGIGPMNYFDPRVWPEKDSAVYLGYLRKLASFVAWLIRQNYTVLFITGESITDRWAIDDLKAILKKEEGIDSERQILTPPIETVEDLINQLAVTDMVVASRLHTVISSHVLYKPVLAISYHEKIDFLMADLGQSEYCLDIARFDVDTLKERFIALKSNRALLKAQIEKKTRAYCSALEEQYDRLFSDLRAESLIEI